MVNEKNEPARRPSDRDATLKKDDATTSRRRVRNTQVGVVVKAKMQKSVVVAVERMVQHAVYRKTIKRTSTFMAHDEIGAKQGDTVRIVETRPLSKLKRWKVEEIVAKATLSAEEEAAV